MIRLDLNLDDEKMATKEKVVKKHPPRISSKRRLDGFLLLAAGGSENPEDIRKVNLSSLGVTEIVSEDLVYFYHLDYLDLSDNLLSRADTLLSLSKLSRITTLSLACNSLTSLDLLSISIASSTDCNTGSPVFPRLDCLDLSFNEIHGDVLIGLSVQAPRLKRLNLSNGCVSSIPPDLYHFKNLIDLDLSGNDLVQFDQWRALECLPVLKILSLARNRIKRLVNEVAVEQSLDEKKGLFQNLEIVDLSDNEIPSLDLLCVVWDFPSLKQLRLYGNPLAGESIEFHKAVKLIFRRDSFEDEFPQSVLTKNLHSVVDPILFSCRKAGGWTVQRELRSYLNCPDPEYAVAKLLPDDWMEEISKRKMRASELVKVVSPEECLKLEPSLLGPFPFSVSSETIGKFEKIRSFGSCDAQLVIHHGPSFSTENLRKLIVGGLLVPSSMSKDGLIRPKTMEISNMQDYSDKYARVVREQQEARRREEALREEASERIKEATPSSEVIQAMMALREECE